MSDLGTGLLNHLCKTKLYIKDFRFYLSVKYVHQYKFCLSSIVKQYPGDEMTS